MVILFSSPGTHLKQMLTDVKDYGEKKALEALDLLNHIKLEEMATSEHNIQVYEALRERLKMLKTIDPERKIHQDTLVETTVIKYDCPMCLPIDDSNYEIELDS